MIGNRQSGPILDVLMYHDVVAEDDVESSGMPGAGPAWYKLSADRFEAHLAAIAARRTDPPILVGRGGGASLQGGSWMLTFDDGGASAITTIAPALERRGWRGVFFVTTDFIGRPGFLTEDQVVDLHRRGHVIGSHSHSHPERISSLPPDRIGDEWAESVEYLEDLLSVRVTAASVPGGFSSSVVVRAAADAGITTLFTSEPTRRTYTWDGCLHIGRYAIHRRTSLATAAALAAGALIPTRRQLLTWHLKRAAKRVGGRSYLQLRKVLIRAHVRR